MYTITEIATGSTGRIFKVDDGKKSPIVIKAPAKYSTHPALTRLYKPLKDKGKYIKQCQEIEREGLTLDMFNETSATPKFFGKHHDTIYMQYAELGSLENVIKDAREKVDDENKGEYQAFILLLLHRTVENIIKLYDNGLYCHGDLRPVNIFLTKK